MKTMILRGRRGVRRLLGIFILLLLTGCVMGGGGEREGLSGTINIDGSSTVFPITEAVAEEFGHLHPGVRVTVGISGTGGGFKKFCSGEIDINDASRTIRPEEIDRCRREGIEYIELTIGYDGLSILIHPQNDFAECMTVEELKRVWEPGSPVQRWSDIRPSWPAEKLFLVGPDTDSGTFDYFTEAIVGEAKASRSDYTASADDNVLVQAVAGERYALGYFGYAYYEENRDKLKLVGVDGGSGCVKPSSETVAEGVYPLSRPLYIYVNRASLQRPEVEAFVEFYLSESDPLVRQVGYVPIPESLKRESLQKLSGAGE
jgi:phosphate transport system substrate-binding protein